MKVKRGKYGCFMFSNEGGNWLPVYEHVPHTKGVINPEFRKKYNLSSSSKPHKCVEVFWPLHKIREKCLFPTEEAKNSPDFQWDFQTLTIWTNLKAKLTRAGPNYYPNLKTSPQWIYVNMSIYILTSFSSPPCLEMKFNTQAVDWINGNDVIATKSSENSICSRQYHAMFKAFLSPKSPLIDPISRSKNPNWKIHSLLAWMNLVFPTAWLFGIKVAIDKMTMCFQRLHIDKRQTTYKAERDGFQADVLVLADEGYCYPAISSTCKILHYEKSTVNICLYMQEW